MNKNRLLLNLGNNFIIFSESRSINSFSMLSTLSSKILFRSKPQLKENIFSIRSVDAVAFYLLVKQSQSKRVEIFAISIKNINTQLIFFRDFKVEIISLFAIESAAYNLKEVKAKLSQKYYAFLDVFNRFQTNKLFSYRFYNYKIELINNFILSQSRAYRISSYKLQKIKKYLNKNLFKGFITLSQTLYFSPVLFAFKINKDLRFCVNYRKLNAIIKRNRYFLSLIEKVIEKLIECKYLTRLDVIVAFNKLRMHLDSENLITFITILRLYKYHVLSFDLINDLSIF